MFLSRLLVVFVLSTFCAVSTFAQGFYAGAQMATGYQPWGTGTWGGSQGCVANNGSGGGRVPKAIRDKNDEIDKMSKEKKRLERDARELKKEIDEKEKAIKDMKAGVNTVFKPEVVDGIKQHIGFESNPMTTANADLSVACVNGQLSTDPSVIVPGAWSTKYCSNAQAVGSGSEVSDAQLPAPAATGSNWQGSWGRFADSSKSKPGTISDQVCTDSAYVKGEYVNSNNKTRTQNNMVEACKKGVVELAEKLSEIRSLKSELDVMNADIKDRDQELKQAKSDRKKLKRDIEDEIEDGTYEDDDDDRRTQADYCPTGNCRGGQRVSTTDRIFSLVGTLGLAAGSYFGARSISRTNAELGWPTSPYLATSIAMPAALAGIYGATYGGGIGGNGCGGFGGPGGMASWPGGAIYNGGAFGYPTGWGPNGGGGVMNGGCGPWGCTGYPGGFPNGGYGVPYANMNGGYVGYAGFPGGYGAYPGGYQGMPMQATYNVYPMPQVGFPGGYAGGYQAYPMAGGPITGVYSTNTGIPMVPYGGNYAGQYTGVGFPGGYSGVYVPTYNGYPMPQVGFPGGFQGGFQGYPMPAGGGYTGTFSGYNQALAYQAAMAQAQAQDYSARLQLTGRLSSQITQIQYQINSILSGVGSASGYGYGGYGSIGYPTGTILPYPGSTTIDPNLNTTTTGTGVLPGRGRFN